MHELCIMNATTLTYLLGVIKGAGRQHHLLVQEKLAQIGRNLGYTSIIEYKAGKYDGRQDIIDVVWLSKRKIIAAFEVRMKKSYFLTTSNKDRKKLIRLDVKKRFLVNVSKISGRNYVQET